MKFFDKILDLLLDKQIKIDALTETKDNSVVTESDLITLLGTTYSKYAKTVVDKVYSVARYYPASVQTHNSFQGGLWKHLYAVATGMAEKFRDTKQAYIAFIVGLLHDIGKIGFFKYQTSYSFNPLRFESPPLDLQIIAKEKNDQHAELGSVIMFYFIQEVIDTLTTVDICNIAFAIRNHHTKIVSENVYLDILRDIDCKCSEQEIQKQYYVTPSCDLNNTSQERESHVSNLDTLPQEHVSNLDTSQNSEQTEIDLYEFRSSFRKLVAQGNFVQDYHFYVTCYNDKNILLITMPKSFSQLVSSYCTQKNVMIHESVFLKILEQQKWIAMKLNDDFVVKATMKFNEKNRTLKFIAFDANRFFSKDEIKQYYTQAQNLKIKGTIL